MATFEGYADPGFAKELAALPPEAQRMILGTLRELAAGPAGHPDVKALQDTRWPGTVRVRCGAFRVVALVLPAPRVILFTTVFRRRRATDYAEALRRHERRVAAQGPPLKEHVST